MWNNPRILLVILFPCDTPAVTVSDPSVFLGPNHGICEAQFSHCGVGQQYPPVKCTAPVVSKTTRHCVQKPAPDTLCRKPLAPSIAVFLLTFIS